MSRDVLALVGGNNQIYPVLIELESIYEGCINSKLHTTLKINLVRVKGENPVHTSSHPLSFWVCPDPFESPKDL